MTLEEHKARFADKKPHLRARMTLYPLGQGPRKYPILPGWAYPCVVFKTPIPVAYDASPILVDGKMDLGEIRDVDFFLLSGQDAVLYLTQKPLFYLWEGGYVGEAVTLKIYD